LLEERIVKISDALTWAKRYFGASIWSAGGVEVRRSRALLYRLSRILYATVQIGREQRLNFRAAALTYFSVLSVVPFLAFAFSILKGFGEYQRLMDETVRPAVVSTFGESPELLSAIEQVLSFVERTSVSRLGAVGILLLAYTSISLLSNIETALNDIWGAKSARPLLRQVTDYTTLMVITPLLVLAAITFATAAQSSGVVSFLRDRLALGILIGFAIKLASIVFGCVALIALFVLMPNVRTRLSSAVFGGIIGGVLWQLLLIVHVKFQMGVANYNALYSGFGAIPIFLVWMYMSWRVVLLGAQLAASHQHEQNIRQVRQARHVDQDLRETLAVAVTALATGRFVNAGPPPTQGDLVTHLQAPAPTVDEVLDGLVKGGILVQAVAGEELGYVPARDIDSVRLADVRDAMRVDGEAKELKEDLRSELVPGLVELLDRIDQKARTSEDNITLRQLADLAGPAVLASARAPAPAERSATVIDGKQPGLSGG
jgi:membrane protein